MSDVTSSESWPMGLLRSLLPIGDADQSPVTHLKVLPPIPGETVDWPTWAAPTLVAAYARLGIERPWKHQVIAAEHAWRGESLVIATGTATGKSLGYQLPVLSGLLHDRRAKALYLSPTKALGHDQLRAVEALEVDPGGNDGIRPAPYDGDTVPDERDWAREHSRWLFSNPDMLSRSILPQHAYWHMYFRRLRYVVIDECHIYRGIFGSHIAHVLRRLRRICAKYGSEPTFVLASATARDPGEIASELTGLACAEVTASQAPHGERTIALWEPPLTELTGEHGAPIRRSAPTESARLLADVVIAGKRTLAFVLSRRSAEIVTLQAQEHLREAGAHELAAQVAAYRAGYLPAERRALENGLNDGTLCGAAATTALELGIDIAGLDAVLVSGFPGTLASLWQQFGRAGRRQQESLAVFIARDDPLDTFLVHNPEAVFDRPIESTVIDPTNPYVLSPQLSCAAYELPITEAEVDDLFGGDAARQVLAGLDGVRRRPTGWFWVAQERPIADIRGSGGTVALIESATGRLLGTVDTGAAPSTAFPGAVYLHRGETWLVDDLDLEDRVAMLHADNPSYSTYAQQQTDIRLLGVRRSVELTTGTLGFVDVEVSNQVVSYQRRKITTNEVIDQIPLDLPAQELRTKAVMWTLNAETLDRFGTAEEVASLLPGALHAAEHASIGLLPLIATCDRWDIGGVSTALHADTGLPSVFVYDGHPGGAGFAERAYERAAEWLGATLSAIESCECASGCPSCIQSPKCGNGNDPLDKGGAVTVLRTLTAALS
ncbi:DEAD/DEAH box helicase domain-containing protein [Antricoccus suffuscus]|uniref:DEAD/DEAH box helicase domain-containing protein n=1 Tax=Antricoccus suffuscus TaxID=1629062 RepID=A0A2T1A465_9ACTN|nr:DEAD/DEAH box helicase [Antricoccus suffuscus]PRZ43118.1 DEAD/DEAH box helicase domain-containing protein [Antricoccus suffuscus]